ncbi:MAG: hypothetical protein ABI876_03550 [Bacteroidota bacterium]
MIESWHRTLKVELVYRQRYRSRDEAWPSIFEEIDVSTIASAGTRRWAI